MFETPILFIIFNRPEITQRVFEEIRKQKPKFLFIAADGPRHKNMKDAEKCQIARDFVVNSIDWDCKVKTLFRDVNLGCGIAVSQAITWFFEHVEQGIILEDDCLPHPSFFKFCETLLEKYKDEERVYGITGDNFQNGIIRGTSTYYFSRYFHSWGWASWRRAWNQYDFYLLDLEVFEKNKTINKIDKRKVFEEYWISILRKTANKEIDTWDYQWLFTVWKNDGIIATPNVNLISNIGFGIEATHTIESDNVFANMATYAIDAIRHPKNMQIHKKADRYTSEKLFKIFSRYSIKKIKTKLKKKIKTFLAPELLDFIKRKLRNRKYQFEIDLLKIPRYTETFINFDGFPLKIPDSASFLFMFKEIFQENIYKFKTSNSKPYIIDGGANIGLATIYLKKLYPSAEIIAFEPDPNIYKILKNNIEVFNFKDVVLLQNGLWNEDKTMLFMAEGADGGIVADVDISVLAQEKIEVISLKPYLKRTVDFLKLDIEGSETIVLRDIEEDLGMIQRIFIEYHSFVNQSQSLNEVIDILTKANFRLHVSSPGLSNKSPFMGLKVYNNMDMQLNIYGFKNETF